MIKNVPIIYPNELFYSFICRMYAQSGIGSSKEFTKLVFEKGTEQPKSSFINKLNVDFKEKLNRQLSDLDILTKHTTFNFYSRFLTKGEKEKAVEEIINGKNSFNYTHTPVSKSESYLRYCPKCVNEDRKKYGECYFHIEHQLDKIRICPHHNCKLINTKIYNGCKNQLILTPLELCEVSDVVDEVSTASMEYKFTRYIYEFLMCEFSFNSNNEIGALLTNKLDSKYFLSLRCKRKDLDLIYNDIVEFYRGYELFDITRRRVAALLRGIEFNAFDILLIAFFEGIEINELCNMVLSDTNRNEEFDKKVIKLYKEGNNYLEVSKIMKVNKETIRKIILKNARNNHLN